MSEDLIKKVEQLRNERHRQMYGENWLEVLKEKDKVARRKAMISTHILHMGHNELVDYIYDLLN